MVVTRLLTAWEDFVKCEFMSQKTCINVCQPNGQLGNWHKNYKHINTDCGANPQFFVCSQSITGFAQASQRE